MASYGKYNYESTESRALKSIKADSYNKDMAKNLIQLNHNSEYMAQYLRKLQKGVDEANQNTIEQVQSLISDIMVLFAGGSDTLLEFGDLKYLLQAVGALFGFNGTPLPVNLLQAAWHFFSSYILPNGDFTEVINLIIDNAIAFILDVFGEVPVIGQALQQLAEWLSDLRDNLLWIINQFQGLIDFLAGIEDAVFGDIWNGLFNKFQLQIDLDFSSPAAFIASLIDALFGDGSFIDQVITGLFGEANFMTNIIDDINSGPNILGSAVQSAIDGIETIDDAIQEAIDSVIAGAGGLIGSGFGLGDLIAQLTGLRNAAAGANDAVLDLQAQVANLDPAASSEVVKFVEFADAASPPSMFTKVNDIGTGNIIVSAGELKWNGTDAGREFYIFNGGPLLTDLFEVTFVLPSVPSHGWFGADGSNYLYLIGRSDSTGSNMVLARLAWDEIRVYSYNSGTFTQIGPTISDPDILTGGCKVSFKGGTVAEPRYFKVSVNGNKLYEATDSVPVSLFGADKRFCGLGIEKGSSYLTGTISTWSMLDGGASAGSGTVAGYTASGLTNLNLWKGTASQYAAITTKNPNTIYVVT